MINTAEEWNKAYTSMNLSPFSEAMFGNLEFMSHNKSLLTLKGDIDKTSIPNSVLSEFEDQCSSFFKVKITLKFEAGTCENSPKSIKMKEDNIKQSSAQKSIANDSAIQDIMKKFNGKIQDGSIKPVD